MSDFNISELEKLQGKGSFLIQKSLAVDLREMGIEETYLFINAVFDYVTGGVEPDLAEQKYRFVRASFNRFKEAYISDSRKWLKSCKNKSEAKSKEWQDRKTKTTKDPQENSHSHPDYP